MRDVRSKTIKGLGWSAISQVVNQGFTFVITIVLARILGPKVYGLVGMMTVFTGFAARFGDLGLGAAIIQRKELGADHLNAAFWANVTVGLGMTLLVMGMAPLVARFYHEPLLAPLTAVVALRFLLDSLGVVQAGLLNRAMEFRKLAAVQTASSILAGLIALTAALSGSGPWSLVIQTVAAAFFTTGVLWLLAHWRPAWSFHWAACKSLLGFSSYLLLFNLINYWSRTLDQLLIGRFLGPASLGIYSRAYSLMLMPLQQISSVVGKVMLPALSSIQEDKVRVRQAYLKAISAISLVTFPMMTGLFAVSEHFVLAVLGNKWAGVIPLLRIFCWIGLVQSVETTLGCICVSQGRARLHFALGAGVAVVFALCFTVGIRWGIMGVAWSYAIGCVLVWYPCWALPGRIIALPVSHMLRALAPTFSCAVAMGGAVFAVDQFVLPELSHWQYLLIEIPLGVAVYLTLVIRLKLAAWEEGRKTFGEMLHGRLRPLKALLLRSGMLKETVLAD